jgi:fructose-1,6-bisphosphatase-3
MPQPREPFSEAELAALRVLAKQFKDDTAATAEIAWKTAELSLPKGVVHVVSDVHGEDVKLRHIINNASGTLRPLVDRVFAERSKADRQELLALLFYPSEALEARLPGLDPAGRRALVMRTLEDLLTVIRTLASKTSIQRVEKLFPVEYAQILREMLHESFSARGPAYIAAIADPLIEQGQEIEFIRLVCRVARNLVVSELVVAGDCVDRGPRGDRVIEYLRNLPNVSFTWGNHDLAWLGAALGHGALIAHVLRISTRYRRLSQLEEGYGVTMQPLEHLVRAVYRDDPAECFMPHGTGLREAVTVARMQKAAAVMQFKLEGQMIARHPEWALDHRRLLRGLDIEKGVVAVDGRPYSLRDRFFPTIDSRDPEALSEEEQTCLDRMRASFLASPLLAEHARFLVARGSSWLRRDDHLIFHGCVPTDEKGGFVPFVIDGVERRGRPLFDAIDEVVTRALSKRSPLDLDFLWYLWSGPLSPMFGKDRITTFERDLVADPSAHVETKNPYFNLIHEREFCERVLEEFGCDRKGLIVNGHVPVKIEMGESPVKRGGNAITIDGAFSPAYGDHGYTLVLESDRTFLARHHHFESVQAAVRDGVDIIPTIATIREFERPRLVGDTEEGARIREDIALLNRLVEAFRHHRL